MPTQKKSMVLGLLEPPNEKENAIETMSSSSKHTTKVFAISVETPPVDFA